MRIRKQHPRGVAGGEGGANLGSGSQEQEPRGVKEKPGDEVQMVIDEGSERQQVRVGIERVDSTSRSAFTWLDKLRYSKGFTEIEPYSNLEDFITSLSKDGGSSSKGRYHEEESDLSRGTPELNAQQLARYNSVCSELSSKQASGVGPEGTPSPALVSCDDSSASLAQAHQLRSDASLPSAVRHCFSVADASIQEALNLEPKKKDKQKGEGRRPYTEPSKAVRKGYAGTSSEKPVHSTVEAVFKQGHDSSIAEPVGTRFGTRPQNDQIQGPTDSTHPRFPRNRRIPVFTDAATAAATTGENPPSDLTPDHPAVQPKHSLVFSLYTVSVQAGKAGLTAREAMSDILQQGLPGLFLEQHAVQSSRQIAKLFRNSPYYMELGEGKFALCSAVIGTEHTMEASQPSLHDEPDSGKALLQSEDVSQKRMQIGSALGEEAKEPESEVKTTTRPGRSGRPKKLKYMKQENKEELGNQCNRTDGKGWVCPLLAKPGYQLCDHHLDKLRCKPGSRSKKKMNTKLAADDATATAAAATTTTTTTTTTPEPYLDTAGHENHHTML